MNCVLRKCVCTLIAIFACFSGSSLMAKDNVPTSIPLQTQFPWQEHTRLSWDDFKGVVNTTQDESAAATYCSIGFKTATVADGSTALTVYNTFYTNKSWVRADARIQSILDHEQGHFDLCEVYTRKLKSLLGNFDLTAANVKEDLMRVYAQVSKDYEARQQAYEEQTTHGTNIDSQKRWQQIIAAELTLPLAQVTTLPSPL